MFFESMNPRWQEWLEPYKYLLQGIEEKIHLNEDVAPPLELVMRAFHNDPATIKVVIVGQDPYPTRGDAVGLAFAMNPERTIPRSLTNIVKELQSDLGNVSVKDPKQIDLAKWVDRGVLLLNQSLTTRVGEANAHATLGWQEFTLAALNELTARQSIVLMLWGKSAQKLGHELSNQANLIKVETAHPSPLSASRGFLGSKPFSQANEALKELGLEPIDWSL